MRGGRPVGIDCIAEVLTRISQLVTDFKEIVELDIDPFAGFEKRCRIIDIRMTSGEIELA